MPPLSRSAGEGEGGRGNDAPVAALVLAGNTPLLAWPPLCDCLCAGWGVFVKGSRDETLWTRLFAESLAEVDPEVAACVHLDVWPGADGDPRTDELCRAADAVVAYGGDAALDALRALTPEATPFFGYGHAVSVGLTTGDGNLEETARGFARDVLMYGQQGCLSPQAIFHQETAARPAVLLASHLTEWLPVEADALHVAPVTDPAVARRVREARDLALFDGWRVVGGDDLRWTVAYRSDPVDLPPPVANGFVHLVPLDRAAGPEGVVSRFGAFAGRVSAVGVAGEVGPALKAALRGAGVSYVCKPGAMQTPPLDWPNGNRDLRAELARLSRRGITDKEPS